MSLERLTSILADRYRIERELGQGGMATVYLAHDVKHDRPVALKVLRPELAAILGGARFLQEIRTTANLQHPHILPLHDSGEVDGTVFYVMPYVEGESLRDRLVREKQLPVDDALRLAREVAGALDYAHRHGVVHRDIKPENILLHDGQALVADFGIALAASRSDGGTRMTETGMSLGTPAYMAPEQAMGEREITARADVYALGCVLYETLTGEPPFTGPTAQAIVARIMTEQPRRLTLQRHTIPPHVEAVVARALEKLPADRFASAKEFADALGEKAFTHATLAAAAAPPSVWRSRPWLVRAVAAVPWVIAAVASGSLWWTVRRAPESRAPVVLRYGIELPDSLPYADGLGATLAVSADGAVIAYQTQRGIAVRFSDVLEPQLVPSSRRGNQPFFSPDGRWLAFRRDQAIVKAPLSGGTPITVCDSCPGFQFSWDTDDTIRFHAAVPGHPNNRQLMSVPAAGGVARVIAAPDTTTAEAFRTPSLLPGRRLVLFNVFVGSTARLAVLDLASGRITRLDQPGIQPRWVDGGYVVLGNPDGSAFALPFDPRRGAVTGAAIPIARGLYLGDFTSSRVAVARNGTLVYMASSQAALRQLAMVSRTGQVADLPVEPRAYGTPRVSYDGRRIAVSIDDGTGGSDVWIVEPDRRTLSRLTTDRTSNYPAWFPDGSKVVYSSNADLWWMNADGSGHRDSLLVFAGNRFAGSVSPDGRRVLFYEEASGRDGIRTLAFDSAPVARTVLPPGFNEGAPVLSPDGAWMAYQSDESGRTEIYVRPFPGPGARVTVSVEGGAEPAWSRDGRELYYRTGDSVLVATVSTRPAFAVSARRLLFVAPNMIRGGVYGRSYDVAGSGFVMVRGIATERSSLVAVHRFFERVTWDAEHQR